MRASDARRVMRGLLIWLFHTCAGSTFEAKFDFGCQKSAVPLARSSDVVKAYLASLFAGDDNEVFPYGVDPAFLRSSQAMYKPELQGSEGWYYNTSDPAQVPTTTKAPYGFFYRSLKVNKQADPRSLLRRCLCKPYCVLVFLN